MHAVLRFEELLTDPELRRTLASDPIVDTTLDLDLQREVSWQTWDAVHRLERRGAGNAAVLVVDRGSWEVVAAVGSTDYFDPDHAGAIDYLRVPRSSGSTLKPFFYALALERGTITPTTILDDLDRGVGGITNADERFFGPLLPRVALANSRNVPAANLLAGIGLDEGYGLLGELGLHDGREPARRYGLGLAIGGLPVTLEGLVRAYTVLAGNGRLQDLVWYRQQPRRPSRLLMSEETARQITLFLADPQARLPSFPRMGWSEFPFAVAVKTGTSSRYRDAWTVAYSARYLVGVWIGHPDFRPMARLSGYRAAAQLVHRIMNLLHRDQQDGLEAVSFPSPRGYDAHRVCAVSGRRATPACARVVLEWLPPGQEVLGACEVHRHLAIDRRDGLLATSATPASMIEVRSFVDLPARYSALAARTGIPHPPRLPSPLGGGDFGVLGPGRRGATQTRCEGAGDRLRPIRSRGGLTEGGSIR
ncbi:MAG: glycosyl transferase, partial [bacterium]|nr:glycosyl transferase [bacterium]